MKNDLYFGKEVDDAILLFIAAQDPKEKSKIFESSIYPAFKKLSEYHYNKLPVIKNAEVVFECVAFLYEQLHKFNPEKQARGFPYFNIIAKHYFIQKIKQEKRERTHEDERLVSLGEVDAGDYFADSAEDQIEEAQFFKILKEHLPIWRDKFVKPQEKQLVECLITLFAAPEDVGIFKKKAVLIYIKEMTGMNTKQIATNLNKIKKKFFNLKSKYQKGEV